jgi:PHS family inorganic phosphate transporter-like MFS transporter
MPTNKITDIAFYGLGLNNTTVLEVIGYSAGNTIYESLYHNAVGNLVLVCAGSIPGYWLSVFLIDTIGRKPIQVVGFLLLTLIFSVIGFTYNHLSQGALLALYILAQLFFNFGPNTTTFIIPGECFPTRYRSTGHGLSAAFGKVGAIVSQVIAQPLLSLGQTAGCKKNCQTAWLPHMMQIFALFMLCGALVSLLIPETKGKTLEELAGERATILDTRTGSITLSEGVTWWGRLNPFSGGRAAGFAYNASPNMGPKSPGILGKRKRLGIMASPELIAKKHGRGSSEDGSGNGNYSMSIDGKGRTEADDDNYINGVGEGRLPGWGAGWAVQRNPRRDGRVESIQLYDVGKLLK